MKSKASESAITCVISLCDSGCCSVDTTSCPAVRAALLVIRDVFGFGSVRPGQLEASQSGPYLFCSSHSLCLHTDKCVLQHGSPLLQEIAA